MTMNAKMPAVIAAAGLLLVGCASGTSQTRDVNARMTPGMIMPDGSTMGATAPSTTAGPSAAALMICARETRESIATVLNLRVTPTPTGRWNEPTYTCTYDLPQGRLVLSVRESVTHGAATRYADQVRRRMPGARPLAGLTDLAYGSPDGTVVLVKDGDTLRVDATGMPAQFGPEGQKRTDFAYEISSDILGCWTGGDGS